MLFLLTISCKVVTTILYLLIYEICWKKRPSASRNWKANQSMTEVSMHVCVPGARGEFDIILDQDDFNERFFLEHFTNNVDYEGEVVGVMLRVIRTGDYCVDVGANIGFYTLLMSRLVGDGGEVLAFEPATNNLPKLRRNIEVNKIANVQLIEQPAWSCTTTMQFHINANSSGSSCLWDPGNFPSNALAREKPENYTVETTTIDDHAKRAIRVVKIDTEGAEQRVLEGMGLVLATERPPFILSELNPFGLDQLGCSTKSLRAFMRQFGYDLFLIRPDGSLPALVPATTEITYENGVVVMNAMFSTLEAVSAAWPRVPYP